MSDDMKITKEMIQKMRRKVRRDIELEQGKKDHAKIHETSKRDREEKKSNTIRKWSDDE